MKTVTLAAATLVLAAPLAAGGQVASRIEAVDDGTVRLEYTTKPDVEICEQGIRMGDRHMRWRSRGWDEEARNCRIGSAEIELNVRRGTVRDIDILMSSDERRDDAVVLGSFDGQEVADYLLGLVRDGAPVGKDAIFPAMIADADEVWRDLLVISKDRSLEDGARKQALFWVGQEAAEAATDGLAEVALDDDEEQDIKNSAIFALSQRPDGEAVPILIEVARTGKEAETRRTAMFWLAQSEDERVIDFFEEVLLGRGR